MASQRRTIPTTSGAEYTSRMRSRSSLLPAALRTYGRSAADQDGARGSRVRAPRGARRGSAVPARRVGRAGFDGAARCICHRGADKCRRGRDVRPRDGRACEARRAPGVARGTPARARGGVGPADRCGALGRGSGLRGDVARGAASIPRRRGACARRRGRHGAHARRSDRDGADAGDARERGARAGGAGGAQCDRAPVPRAAAEHARGVRT